ncbi:hypothetical protein RFI_03392 [Reticulomyxa filosa]|uniref:Caspase family p20 domain-containing protein n=1 Tax=Reticulomyxa filosa TaxID=46433 RepID=X6P6G8_RETFI|nr:hypothetical protein RFI_03392 [Reticulomyxa filosa]|eukprot:ETO33708.1 hypothetical protein RFI_03392 [Reticulomyxa filosa]
MKKRTTSHFQSLTPLPTLLLTQCVVYKDEILICGAAHEKNCYSYHTIKNEYKLICSYPSDIRLNKFCVTKLLNKNNNDNPNEITLLFFDGKDKHTLIMNYKSVWSEENKNGTNETKKYNEWVYCNKSINIRRYKDNCGMRSVIGGMNNNLLFITYFPKNIAVFDLNTFQCIKDDSLPTEHPISSHCFILRSEKKNKNEMLLFVKMKDCQLNMMKTLENFILINCPFVKAFRHLIHMLIYSIQKNEWITFSNALPIPLFDCAAVLNKDNTYIYILGEIYGSTTSMKTKVSTWLSEEETKRNRSLCVTEEKKDEQMNEYVNRKEERRKWMKWWKERNEKDKADVIKRFEQLSSNDFERWLLKESKWKTNFKKQDMYAICIAIEAYINYCSSDDEYSKVYVIINGKKELIKMKELTFEELVRQSFSHLKLNDFKKIENENLKLKIMDTNNKIIDSDEDIKQKFNQNSGNSNNEPLFKITWTQFEQRKIIKNPLVIIIAISEYEDKRIWSDLSGVKEKDLNNYKQLFQKELKYEVIHNQCPKMTKQDVQNFMDKIILKNELRKNRNNYDGLIIIICGHGKNDNLIASDGKEISIDKIFERFNCTEMEAFKHFPKMCIIDICRGKNIPVCPEITEMRGNNHNVSQLYEHNGVDYLIIWSTTKGYQIPDLGLLSTCIKDTVIEKYKTGCSFNQILKQVQNDIFNYEKGKWYCIEVHDTTSYVIVLVARQSAM